MLWFTVSKAFEDSKKIPMAYSLLSNEVEILSVNSNRAIYAEWFFWKSGVYVLKNTFID